MTNELERIGIDDGASYYFPEGENPGDIGLAIIESRLNDGLELAKTFTHDNDGTELVAVIPGEIAGQSTEIKLNDIHEVEIRHGHANFHVKEHLKEVVVAGFTIGAVAATVWHRRHKSHHPKT